MTTYRSPLACLLLLLGLGCGGPLLILPGGELRGEVVSPTPDDFSFLSDGVFELETRPDDPYSVQLNYFVRNGRVYIDPAEGRRWLDNIRADPRVRARFEGRVYELEAVRISDPAELAGFDPERQVYRLDPRG